LKWSRLCSCRGVMHRACVVRLSSCCGFSVVSAALVLAWGWLRSSEIKADWAEVFSVGLGNETWLLEESGVFYDEIFIARDEGIIRVESDNWWGIDVIVSLVVVVRDAVLLCEIRYILGERYSVNRMKKRNLLTSSIWKETFVTSRPKIRDFPGTWSLEFMLFEPALLETL
jgi:hypothetical protein